MPGEQIVWAGGEHTFFLGIGEIRALQKACDAGPFVVYGRLVSGQWHVEDVFDTIRLGMIGGGATEAEARDAVERHVAGDPKAETFEPRWSQSVILATRILTYSLFGDSLGEDDVGEIGAGEVKTTHSPAENSDSPDATVSAQQ